LFEAVEQVARAASQIEAEPGFGRLVPQVGMNIAHAPKGCRGIDDVVGLTGRIVLVSGRPRSTGCPMAGGSSHMGRMALALRRQTETLGACMNVRYGEETMKAAAAVGLKAAEFERSSEPPGEDTMSWGLRRALESVEGTPDIVYDLGAPGKEGMIRILGVDPDDAIRKARRILDAIE
jgi:hydroxymethylpyrimidine/phosphomethylpyrimidine kinase